MNVNKKLMFQVKKEMKDLSIENDSDGSIDTLLQRICNKYSEYSTHNADTLRNNIKDAVQLELSSTMSDNDKNSSKVMSLNQSLASSYKSGGSKRHRPASEMDQNENQDNQKEQDQSEKGISSIVTKKKKNSRSTPRSQEDELEINDTAKKSGFTKYLSPTPNQRLTQLAGIDSIIEQIEELVFFPAKFPFLYRHLGVRPPCGILLYGPSGCGKTTLANAIAGELGLPFFKVSAPELIGGTSGESEENIRELFKAAIDNTPSVLFIDSLDVIAGKKESSQRGMDRRIIAQLFDSIDSILSLGRTENSLSSNKEDDMNIDTDHDEKTISSAINDEKSINGLSHSSLNVKNDHVILIAATNKPESLDPGVRGRFSREIALPVPDASARTSILSLLTKEMKLSSSIDLCELGKLTPGFVGADLQALVREAGMNAVSRYLKDQKHISNIRDLLSWTMIDSENAWEDAQIQQEDFVIATKSVQPTAKREGFAVVPNVTWDDVGALAEVREELLHNVLEPIAHPERFRMLGLEIPAGVLFFGPPGCGKTLLAKAIANQSGANFISVKGPELLNMYVGESESRVREVFSRARASSPCVIFFDELDALCPKRGSHSEGSNVSERVVNQLLTELDGLEVRKDVYIIAATNRLELIDDAMLRPGRLGKLLYVPLPQATDRNSILQALTKKINIRKEGDDAVDIHKISLDERANGFSGADLAALVREAGLAVVKEWRDLGRFHTMTLEDPQFSAESAQVCQRHFEAAFGKVKPSVAQEDRMRYEKVHHYIKSGQSALQALKQAALDMEDFMG